MILVDASVLIDFLRTKDANLSIAFRSLPVAICGVTRSEILAGARGGKDHERLLRFLDTFQQMAIPNSSWDSVGNNLASLYSSGITVPFPDAVIASLGIENQMEVWARDPHFQAMQTILRTLQLYQEPP